MYTNTLKAIFSSGTRISLLNLFLLSPEEAFYQRQIEQKTRLPIRAIQREIRNLCATGLLLKKASGNRIYYSLNKAHPIINELKGIFLKSSGVVGLLNRRLTEYKDIEAAFIYGSYAKNRENMLSDIDLFVIGDIPARKLSSLLSREKAELGREINFSLYSRQDFRKNIKEGNHFLVSVLKGKKIFIVGNDDDLKAIRAGR